MTAAYTSDEMMTVAAARQLHNGTVCFVGIGLPSTAANLARVTSAPDVVLIYESGTLGAKPDRLPLSIGDGILAETADAVVSVPEVFNYWLQPGRIDVGFLSAAQIDRYANINTTVIGADYRHPRVRLPVREAPPRSPRRAVRSSWCSVRLRGRSSIASTSSPRSASAVDPATASGSVSPGPDRGS